jgi:hypothetical protein
MLSEQSNKDPSLSWRRDDRFSAQNGKDEPNLRAARAWQKKTIEEKNVNKNRCDMLIDRLDVFLNRPWPLYRRWTLLPAVTKL